MKCYEPDSGFWKPTGRQRHRLRAPPWWNGPTGNTGEQIFRTCAECGSRDIRGIHVTESRIPGTQVQACGERRSKRALKRVVPRNCIFAPVYNLFVCRGFFTMKVPASGGVNGQACLPLHTDICRASRYEQEGRQAGLRIPAAIAGVRSTEQSTFIYGDVCVSRHVRLL